MEIMPSRPIAIRYGSPLQVVLDAEDFMIYLGIGSGSLILGIHSLLTLLRRIRNFDIETALDREQLLAEADEIREIRMLKHGILRSSFAMPEVRLTHSTPEGEQIEVPTGDFDSLPDVDRLIEEHEGNEE